MNNFIRLWVLAAMALASCAAPAAPASVTPPLPATAPPRPTSPPAPTATDAPTATPAPTATEATVVITDVIEYEMRGSFDFFWEQANTEAGSPGFGLIRDRYPGSEGIASIASVGFGLTAYAIGVEKGYVSREAALARVEGTLETLLAMDRVEGFYYHFVDQRTGKRAWNSEVSSIDTAILLMGVLTAGEYFGGTPARQAQALYEAVNWPWFVDADRQMFYMAYRPEKGFEGHWDFYAEQLMLYVLAAGSPTHPVDAGPYYAFTRHTARFGEGEPFIHSWFGSLFTYQYSHAWLDFRGTVDREGVDWFANSVTASLAQVDFATRMERKYQTLGPDAWGLSASDGPEGYDGRYGAPPSGYDNRQHRVDDTIPPSAAIGSILFVPEAAERALRHYYTLERLQSRYGLLDAYNLSVDWYATDVIGIDKGITLLMLANHQGELVYQITRRNPWLTTGLERLEIRKKD